MSQAEYIQRSFGHELLDQGVDGSAELLSIQGIGEYIRNRPTDEDENNETDNNQIQLEGQLQLEFN